MGAGALVPEIPSLPTLPEMLGISSAQMEQMMEQARMGMMLLIGIVILSKLYPIVFPRPDPMEKMMEMQMQQMQMERMMKQNPYGS